VTTLCRDRGVLAFSASPGERCGACGAPRQIHHAALHTLSIAHVDCDAFYATVEKRDRPDLADRPVIIGGGGGGSCSPAAMWRGSMACARRCRCSRRWRRARMQW
jgi:DNA polymerase IV